LLRNLLTIFLQIGFVTHNETTRMCKNAGSEPSSVKIHHALDSVGREKNGVSLVATNCRTW